MELYSRCRPFIDGVITHCAYIAYGILGYEVVNYVLELKQ